jgi:cystathionine beta-lyase/cystathionine gamma-synthase
MFDPLLGSSQPMVPPLFQSAVYNIPDVDAIDRIYTSKEPGFIYARDAHPNAWLLARELARLEHADWAVVCGSGMSAISATVLAFLKHGDRILASDRLYGRTTQFLGQELGRLGVQTQLLDIQDLGAVRSALEQPAKLLIVETLSNPLLRMADIPALAELCHSRSCLLFVDNTFATPALLRPLEIGADLVMESLTKMIAGHSDVTLGVVAGKYQLTPKAKPAPEPMDRRIGQVVTIWGLMSSPFECWLAQRGLGTLTLRATAASANAAALAAWIVEQEGVNRVVYPGRTDHPDHNLARRLLSNHFGSMLCFELAGGREAVNRFMQRAKAIPFSPSLGHFTTTCSHPASTSHRYADPDERSRQGITDGLIRLSVGCEPFAELQAEMARGLRENAH